MSKRKFVATNRDHFAMGRTKERISQELRGERKLADPHRELLLPLDIMGSRKQGVPGKSLRSEGKSSYTLSQAASERARFQSSNS